MAKLSINLGTNPNDGTGDNLRGGGTKINANFDEIYASLGDGSNLINSINFADTSSTTTSIAVGETLKVVGGTGVNAVISGDTLTLSADNSIMTDSGTVTMTNKTMALGSNTVSGTTAQFNTALTDDDFATLTNAVTLTNKNLTSATNTFTPITLADDTSTTTTIGLGETLKVSGGNGVATSISGDTVTISASGITNAQLSGSAGISNANLANSSFTLGASTVALGGTVSSLSNFNLSGTSSLSGTGTIDQTGAGSKIRFNFAGTGLFPNESTYEGMFAYDTSGDKPYVADAAGWINILTENDGVERHPNVNISGIANGNVLVWSSANGRFEPGSASGIASVAADTTPQLGGKLFAQGNDIDMEAGAINDADYVALRSPDYLNAIQTIVVTVASKTFEHTDKSQGSSQGYLLDGVEAPHLMLTNGVYRFDQSDVSNAGHPLAFYYDVLKARSWTTNVTTNGTAGSAGAYTQISVEGAIPAKLSYQCTAHPRMGGRIKVIGGRFNGLDMGHDKSFSADGSDTTMTILPDRDVNNVFVFVNGICLVPTDDYTISGTTLTFNTAPANGAEVVVRYMG